MYKPIYIFFLQMEKNQNKQTNKQKTLYEHVGSLLNV